MVRRELRRMVGVSALIRDGGQVGGGNLAVLTFVLLLEFVDAHVPRGLLQLGRGVELSFLGATFHVSTHAPSTCTVVPTPRAGPAQRFQRREGVPPLGPTPAPPESSGGYPRVRGRTPGLPRGASAFPGGVIGAIALALLLLGGGARQRTAG